MTTQKGGESMKTFEISSKQSKNGRRKFKVILYKIFPDSCVDETNQVGTMYNRNGITWLREYCEKALPSIKGMSLRCEFADAERTELLGHGATDIIDGMPVFEDAVQIGTFTNGYIDEVETDEGIITACIGEGEIDAQCYHNLVTKLDDEIEKGIYPHGSVEIMKTEDNDGIIYKYGYVDKGRIPTEFIHSGYALLGITPADDNAKLIELNEKNKEDSNKMTESEIKDLIEKIVAEMLNKDAELNKCKKEMNEQIAEANAQVEAITAEKNALMASSDAIQKALDAAQAELGEKYAEIEKLYAELDELRDELGKARARERVGEMNAAIAGFSDEEKAYASAEMEAFMADPVTSEINTVVSKIWEGIGKKAKEAVVVIENNAAVEVEDIFSEVAHVAGTSEDISIF